MEWEGLLVMELFVKFHYVGFKGGSKLKLKLVKLENRYKDQLFDMMDEWYSAGEI